MHEEQMPRKFKFFSQTMSVSIDVFFFSIFPLGKQKNEYREVHKFRHVEIGTENGKIHEELTVFFV